MSSPEGKEGEEDDDRSPKSEYSSNNIIIKIQVQNNYVLCQLSI